jgi:DNA-binding IclR family transcriptional regulator
VQRIVTKRRRTHSGRALGPVEDLLADLAAIRERGYGTSGGLYTPGVGTIAYAVRTESGDPVLALSVDFLIGEETRSLGEQLPTELAACVAEIERITQAT